MKKITLILVFIMSITAVLGQNKNQEKQIKCFVDEAVKEYHLDPNEEVKMTRIRTDFLKSYNNVKEAYLAGEISLQERKGKMKEANSVFNKAIIKLTGKSYKQLKPFLIRTRDKIKNLK